MISGKYDMHGGYGECQGFGRVWVEDGQASNWYDNGCCPKCVQFAERLHAVMYPDTARQTLNIIREEWKRNYK